MIKSLMTEKCTHLLRSAEPDTHGEFEYTPQSPDLDCWFVDEEGKIVKNRAGEDVVITGRLYLVKEISVDDRLSYQGYEYEIVTMAPLKSAMTGRAQCFRYRITKRRPYNEEQVEIS